MKNQPQPLLDYRVKVGYLDNILKVIVRSPFDPHLSLETDVSIQEIINKSVLELFRKCAEIILRKALNSCENNEKRTELYFLLSQLYQPTNFSEMLTKVEQFSDMLNGIEEFEMVKFFLKKHLKK